MVLEADFINIDILSKLDLPFLPILKGKKDYKQQQNSVSAYFEVLELERFLLEDIKKPNDLEMKKKQLKYRHFIIVYLLKAINSEVQKDMKVLGQDIKNPFNII